MTPPNPPMTPPTPPPTPKPPPVEEENENNGSGAIHRKGSWEDKYRYKEATKYINNLPTTLDEDDKLNNSSKEGSHNFNISTVSMDEDDPANGAGDNISLDGSIQSERSWMSGTSRGTSVYGGVPQSKTIRENMRLRAQLWDAYRLARIILGRSIGTTFTLESGTILNAIRHVAEMKLELLTLRKEVEFLEHLENQNGRHEAALEPNSTLSLLEQSFDTNQSGSKQAQLVIQVANLKRQLSDQQSKYQELSCRHTKYVTETKEKLEGILVRLEQLPKPVQHDHQANEILRSLQQLTEQVAEASLKTKIDELQSQHDAAQNSAQQAHQQLETLRLKKSNKQDVIEQQKEIDMTRLRYQLQLEENLGHLESYKEQVKRQQQELLYYRKKCERLEQQGGGLLSSTSSAASNRNGGKQSKKKRSPITPQAIGVAAASTTVEGLQEIIHRLQQQQLASKALRPATTPTTANTKDKSKSSSIPEDDVPPDSTAKGAVRLTANSEQQEEEEALLRQHVIKLLQKMVAAHKREDEVKELKMQLQAIKGKESESEAELNHLQLQLDILQSETKLPPLEWERQIKADRTLYKQRLKACVAQEESRIQQMEHLEKQCQTLTMTAIEIEDLQNDLKNNRNVQDSQLAAIRSIGETIHPQMQTVQVQLKDIQSNQQQSLDTVVNALELVAKMATTTPNQEFKAALKELQHFASDAAEEERSSQRSKPDEDNPVLLAKQLQRDIQKVSELRNRLFALVAEKENETQDDTILEKEDSEGLEADGDGKAGILC